MRKLMKLFMIGLCISIFLTGVPVWGTTDDTSLASVGAILVLMESVENLDENSSAVDIQKVNENLKAWEKELEEQKAAIDVEVNAAETGGVTGAAGTMSGAFDNNSSLGPTGSLQLMFAALQLEQSQIAKNQMQNYVAQIQQLQVTQKSIAQMIANLGAMQSSMEEDSKITLPEDMKSELVQLGICPNNHSLLMKSEVTKEDVHDLIMMSEMRQQQVGMESQMAMVNLQDYAGQYNSYLEGANTQISNANQTLTSLAKGMTLSGDGNSMLFTTGILGIGMGVIGTLLVQKFAKKRKKG